MSSGRIDWPDVWAAAVAIGLLLAFTGFICLCVYVAGCSLAIGADAELACLRIEAAISAYSNRCHASFRGELADCDELTVSDKTASDAAKCEQALAVQDCETTELPEPCRLSGGGL